MTPSATYHDGYAVAMRGGPQRLNPHFPLASPVSYEQWNKGYSDATYALGKAGDATTTPIEWKDKPE